MNPTHGKAARRHELTDAVLASCLARASAEPAASPLAYMPLYPAGISPGAATNSTPTLRCGSWTVHGGAAPRLAASRTRLLKLAKPMRAGATPFHVHHYGCGEHAAV